MWFVRADGEGLVMSKESGEHPGSSRPLEMEVQVSDPSWEGFTVTLGNGGVTISRDDDESWIRVEMGPDLSGEEIIWALRQARDVLRRSPARESN